MTTLGEEQARRAGRGGVAVLGAKVFFVATGLAQQILLPRAIGLAGYGVFSGRVLPAASVVYNVVIAGSVQGVSRTISRSFGHERGAFRAVFRTHVKLALALAGLFALMAPAFAWFAGAHIAVPIAVMSLVILLYGVYAPFVGLLNGRGEFTRQASLDITFAVFKTVAMVGVGWLFVRQAWPGATGAALGFAVAAALILMLAVRVALPLRTAPTGEAPPAPTPAAYLGELWPLGAAQFFTNAVMQVDILLLGHFLSTHAERDAALADEWVGVYRACQLFAFLPYQLLLSITQILFPMLARARAEGDAVRVRAYVERGARLAAIACGLMVSVLVAIPESVIRFAYTADIAARGAHTLRILALGQGAYTMLAIASTTLSSLGRERQASRVTLVALFAVLAGCSILGWRASFGEAQLMATAVGTTAGLTVALFLAVAAVRREAGGFIPLTTVARVLVAVAAAGAVGALAPCTGRALTPIVAIGVAGLYLVVLAASRELTGRDAHALKALRGG
jgi:stage V sporulation protein B